MYEHRGINKNVILLSLLIAPSICIQSRSVNLALETSFLFDPQDIKENATFINKVQNVLDKLKTVLEPSGNKPTFRNQGGDDQKVVLTSFISQIGSSLIQFDNDDIKIITADLRDAVYKMAENEDFNELFDDERLRNFIKNTVKIWADTDPMILKVEIAKHIINVDPDAVVDLFKIINKVFETTDEPKFKKLSKKFKKSVKQKDFNKFLTKTIDFVVFKRFNKLNFLVKHIIKDELKRFTNYVSKEYKNRIIGKDRRFGLTDIGHSERVDEGKDTSESNEKHSDLKASDELYKNDKDLNVNVSPNEKNGISLKIH